LGAFLAIGCLVCNKIAPARRRLPTTIQAYLGSSVNVVGRTGIPRASAAQTMLSTGR
jgi:hypothetical protein